MKANDCNYSNREKADLAAALSLRLASKFYVNLIRFENQFEVISKDRKIRGKIDFSDVIQDSETGRPFAIRPDASAVITSKLISK